MSKKLHVTKHPSSGGWQVIKDGYDRASRAYDEDENPLRKNEAKEYGRKLAKNRRGSTELVIHNSDGKIIEKKTYGLDSYPPKG